MCFSFQFFFSSIWKKKETKHRIYNDDNIPDISSMDAESIPAESIISNGKPVEKKRKKRKHNPDAYNPQTSRKVEKIEAESSQKGMYFIF